jgi:hypothetical protein
LAFIFSPEPPTILEIINHPVLYPYYYKTGLEVERFNRDNQFEKWKEYFKFGKIKINEDSQRSPKPISQTRQTRLSHLKIPQQSMTIDRNTNNSVVISPTMLKKKQKLRNVQTQLETFPVSDLVTRLISPSNVERDRK